MLTLPTLTTKRLHLRPFATADLPCLELLANDKRIADNIGFAHPYTLTDAENFLRKIADQIATNKGFSLAIVITEWADLIGSIGCDLNLQHARASFGYWIGVPFWGRGYMTEAGHAFVQHLFGVLNLNRICATHHAQNPASGRVMQKIGMVHESTARQGHRRAEGFVDEYRYAILRDEWQHHSRIARESNLATTSG